jgi:hypothetical protein
LYQALIPDQLRVLGPDHPDTLASRHGLAWAVGQAGDWPEAVRLYQALIPDQLRVLGPDHPDTLDSQHNLAHAVVRASEG